VTGTGRWQSCIGVVDRIWLGRCRMSSPPSRIWSPFCDLPEDRTDTVTVVRGEGAYVYDSDDNRYLDATAGLWYSLIGHGRDDMASAIAAQVRTLEAFKTHGEYDNLPARALADELSGLFPIDDPLVFFTSGGGDSIETACKLARSYWSTAGLDTKRLVLTREGGYHGMHGFGSRISGIDALRVGSEDGYPASSVPANDIDALEEAITRIGPENIAAFVAEPVIGAGGVIPPAPRYLEGAQDLCRAHSILFISDEVVTAFGRLGVWSGAELYGLEPDIMVLAKGINSGYVPLGAVLASRQVWSSFEETRTVFRHGYTYSGHPTACAAALKNLEILRTERLLDRTASLAGTFSQTLRSLTSEAVITDVRTVGLMAGIGLDHASTTTSRDGRRVDLGAEMVRLCRRRGVIVRRMFQGDLQISPPLIIDEAEVSAIATAVRDAAAECSDTMMVDA
jgi:putrescine aminotransferase